MVREYLKSLETEYLPSSQKISVLLTSIKQLIAHLFGNVMNHFLQLQRAKKIAPKIESEKLVGSYSQYDVRVPVFL